MNLKIYQFENNKQQQQIDLIYLWVQQQEIHKMERYRSFRELMLITLNVCLSSIAFGFGNTYFNSINFDDIVNLYSLQSYSRSSTQGALTGVIAVTGGIGAYSCQFLMEKYSRLNCFKILAICLVVACAIQEIPHIYCLFISRIFQGFIIGMYSVISPIYVKEFVPVQVASSLCVTHQILTVSGITSGFFLSFVLSLIFPVWIYCRIVFGFLILTAIFQYYNFTYRFPFETPKYLMLRGQQTQTRKLLSTIYKQQYVNQIFEDLKLAMQVNQRKDSQRMQIQMKEMNEDQALKQQFIPKDDVKFTHNKLVLIVAFYLSVHQQMVGMGPILAYSGQIVGILVPSMQKIFPIIINLFALSGCLLAIPLVQYLGRKKNLEYGALFISICLLLLAIALMNFNFEQIQDNSLVMSLCIMVLFILIRIGFSLTLGPIIWLYISQIVQPNIMSSATMINWSSVAIINFVFPIINQKIGGNPGPIFLFFAVYTFISYIFNHLFLIETANKTQHQIRKQFDTKWK